MTLKANLRKNYFQVRKALSEKRRHAAPIAIQKILLDQKKGSILSYASMGTELNLSSLNLCLAKENRLLLPRVEESGLVPYHVENPDTQLKLSRIGILEPDPLVCKKGDVERIDHALIPALAFDRSHHRLGYGKGCYDKFLEKFPHLHTIGVGFEEQLHPDLLPRDVWDIFLKELIFV